MPPHTIWNHPLIRFGWVFLVAFVVLFAGMTRRAGFYDEGIVLTGAMRVAAGQIPHRDFRFIYGPAEIYILSGLFKWFGTSLLTERLFDLTIKALLVASFYAIALSRCRRTIAAFVSAVLLMWLFGMNEFGLATTPISLLSLLGSSLILPALAGRVSMRRMVAAGAISGTAALFRYDIGIALLGVHACVLFIAILVRTRGTRPGLLAFASTSWPYLIGFAVLTLPPTILYLSHAPVAPILNDVVRFPARNYYRARNLPFPGIDLKGLETLGVYLPIVIAALALYALLPFRSESSAPPTLRREGWLGFMGTFTLLLIVMYLKGLVRVSPLQMYLAIVPSLLVVAVLFEHRSAFPVVVRAGIHSLLWLSLLPALWSALHAIRFAQVWHCSAVQRMVAVSRHAIPAPETAWCKLQNPFTVGFCFMPEDDRMRTVEFIDSHTTPGQMLFVGLNHHDRVFANDNILYFATQRLPATRWSHFDPDLTDTYDIQTQMVNELERNRPPYIVLDAEFEGSREPNDSSRSSGVMVLDRYIHDHYQLRQTFGTMSIWQRSTP